MVPLRPGRAQLRHPVPRTAIRLKLPYSFHSRFHLFPSSEFRVSVKGVGHPPALSLPAFIDALHRYYELVRLPAHPSGVPLLFRHCRVLSLFLWGTRRLSLVPLAQPCVARPGLGPRRNFAGLAFSPCSCCLLSKGKHRLPVIRGSIPQLATSPHYA
jgi:hypothetical protein